MKNKIILIALLSINTLFPCGFYPDVNMFYYSLFTSDVISDELYYLNIESKINNQENIDNWKALLGDDFSDEEVNLLIYNYSENVLNQALQNQGILKGKKVFSKINAKEIVDYLILVKKIALISEVYDHWQYSEGKINYNSLIDKTLSYYKTFNSKNIKERLMYQLVRLYRYNKEPYKAIEAFEQHSPNKQHPIYYYTLEHIAGIQYYKYNRDKAIQNFFEVIKHSKDRKNSVIMSLKLINYNNTIPANLTNKEKEVLYFCQSKFGNHSIINSLNNIGMINPNSDYLKILTVDLLDKMNSTLLKNDALDNYNDYKPKEEFNFIDDEINDFIQFIDTKTKTAKDTDFWKLSKSYVLFLQKKYDKAKTILKGLNTSNPYYKIQKAKQEVLIIVNEATTINKSIEEQVFTKLKPLNTLPDFNNNEYSNGMYNTDFKDYILDIMGTKYKTQGDLAKSFLCHNDLDDMNERIEIDILNDVLKFINQPKKNNFETFLNTRLDENSTNLIYDLKGTYYLQHFNYQKADECFSEISNTYTFKTLSSYNSKNLNQLKVNQHFFATFFKEGYSLIPSADDSFMENYPFLEAVNDKKSLTKALIKLDKLTKGSNKTDAMWANYLLANYLYNTSLYGTNRHFYYFKNGGSGDFIYKKKETNTPIEKLNNFKTYIVYNTIISPYDLIEKHYQKCYELTSSNEFRAQLLFLLAKNEQARYYYNSVDKYSWYNSRPKKPDAYYDYFDKLETFNNTSFYREEASRCDNFSNYIDKTKLKNF